MNFVRINGFPNYVIHPAGTILRIWKNKTKEMKTYNEPNGYMRIELSNNGKPRSFSSIDYSHYTLYLIPKINLVLII